MKKIQNKLFLTSAFALIAVLIFGWIFWSLVLSVQNLHLAIDGIKSGSVFSDSQVKDVKTSAEVIDRRGSDIARINGFFVSKANPVSFVENLETLAAKTGNNFAIDLDENKSKQGDLYFRLTLEGDGSSVTKYLQLLELLPYKISVESLNLQKGGEMANSSLTLRAKLANPKPTHRLILLISVKSI